MTVSPNGYRIRCDIYTAILHTITGVQRTLHCVLALELLGEIASHGDGKVWKEVVTYFLIMDFMIMCYIAQLECASFHVQVVSVDCSSEYKIEVQRSWSILYTFQYFKCITGSEKINEVNEGDFAPDPL